MNVDEMRLIDSEIKRLIPIFRNEFMEYLLPKKYMFFRYSENFNDILDFGSGIGSWNEDNKIYYAIQNSEIFKKIAKDKEYGLKKGKELIKEELIKNEEYIINDLDFLDYLEYVKDFGLKEIDYALDILPHNIMHLIGSSNGVLGEGITELRTREVCLKHEIRYAPVTHSKEAKLINLLENFFTKRELNEACFYKDFSPILKKCDEIFGKEFKPIYEDICGQYNLYISSTVRDMTEHYKRYRDLDFSKIYDLINNKIEMQKRNKSIKCDNK